jgi:hypothetical protein
MHLPARAEAQEDAALLDQLGLQMPQVMCKLSDRFQCDVIVFRSIHITTLKNEIEICFEFNLNRAELLLVLRERFRSDFRLQEGGKEESAEHCGTRIDVSLTFKSRDCIQRQTNPENGLRRFISLQTGRAITK